MKTTEQNWYVLDDPRIKNDEDTPSFKSGYIATTPHWHGINGLNCKARIVCELHEVEDKAEVAKLIAAAPEMLKALKMLREKLFADEFYDGKAIQDTLDQVICNATGGGQL